MPFDVTTATQAETDAHNAAQQARYRFLIVGVYPSGHGVTERWVVPADVHAVFAEIQRGGAMPVIASVWKDGAPIESPAIVADSLPTQEHETPHPAEFGVAVTSSPEGA